MASRASFGRAGPLRQGPIVPRTVSQGGLRAGGRAATGYTFRRVDSRGGCRRRRPRGVGGRLGAGLPGCRGVRVRRPGARLRRHPGVGRHVGALHRGPGFRPVRIPVHRGPRGLRRLRGPAAPRDRRGLRVHALRLVGTGARRRGPRAPAARIRARVRLAGGRGRMARARRRRAPATGVVAAGPRRSAAGAAGPRGAGRLHVGDGRGGAPGRGERHVRRPGLAAGPGRRRL